MIMKLGMTLLLLVGSASANGDDTPRLEMLVKNALDVARVQGTNMTSSLKDRPGLLPKTLAHDGRLETCGPDWWTSGFFPGVLWFIYENTGDEGVKLSAQEYTLRIEAQKNVTSHHDVGFMIFSNFGNGYRLTKDPKYRQVVYSVH